MIPEVKFKQGDVFLFKCAYWVLAVGVFYPMIGVGAVFGLPGKSKEGGA